LIDRRDCVNLPSHKDHLGNVSFRDFGMGGKGVSFFEI